MGDVITYREIYPDNKGRHFKALHKASGIAYEDMLFFDDCIYGDNCRDVEWACPGVVTVKTPEGLTPEKWAEVRSTGLICLEASRPFLRVNKSFRTSSLN